MYDLFIFVLCLLDNITAIGLSIYMIVTLSDIQFDYINVKHGCDTLNKCVPLEMVLSGFVPLSLLFSGYLLLSIIACPLTAYLIYSYFTLPKSSIGIYDAADIRNGNTLVNFQKESFVKIALHLIIFFIVLYFFLVRLLT